MTCQRVNDLSMIIWSHGISLVAQVFLLQVGDPKFDSLCGRIRIDLCKLNINNTWKQNPQPIPCMVWACCIVAWLEPRVHPLSNIVTSG